VHARNISHRTGAGAPWVSFPNLFSIHSRALAKEGEYETWKRNSHEGSSINATNANANAIAIAIANVYANTIANASADADASANANAIAKVTGALLGSCYAKDTW
jgi:hypothetical protein